MIDDIDLGGEICGVVRVPSEPIVLCDSPEPEIKPIRRATPSSRNPVDVSRWDGATYVLTLSAGIRLSRKNLSDAIAEWRIAHPRIDRVKVYVPRHPLMNLPIHVLKSCGFARTSVTELVWERDMTQRAPKPAPAPPTAPKEERWDSVAEELKSLRERQAFCAAHKIVFMQSELDRIQDLTLRQDEERAFKNSPAMKALDAEIEEIQKQLDGES
jgi:hypothetical protein